MTEVISVRFRGGCKTYFFDPRGVQVTAGEHVIVETAQGLEYAQCAEGNHEVPDEQVVEPFRPMVRIATDHDRRVLERNRAREKEAFDVCQKKILQHKLEMKLVRVECSFDGNKILFFFTADGRVDFRELVKDLASAFRARIELRQIGVRDEAKMLGGLGICGRPFCCAQFLDDFMPVSIKMAKTQSLSLNPTKISGTCGRLMCCLKYEQEAYEDALKRLPKNDSFVQTPDGPGNVSDVNVLKETVKVRLDEKPEAPRCYHNCEVCVLRNGKGSREGIEIPKERPARYTEERQEEFPVPAIIADFAADREEPEEGRRRSRRRKQFRLGAGSCGNGLACGNEGVHHGLVPNFCPAQGRKALAGVGEHGLYLLKSHLRPFRGGLLQPVQPGVPQGNCAAAVYHHHRHGRIIQHGLYAALAFLCRALNGPGYPAHGDAMVRIPKAGVYLRKLALGAYHGLAGVFESLREFRFCHSL